MNEAMTFLKGKRTYYCALVAILYIGGALLGFYDLDERVLAALGFGGLAFLRAALNSPQRSEPDGRGAEGTRSQTASTVVPIVLIAAVLSLAVGCSTFVTDQRDVSYDGANKVREVSTRAKARTFWDSKSALATFNATQTDKSQSAKVGGLNQESSGTNAVSVLNALGEIVKALPK